MEILGFCERKGLPTAFVVYSLMEMNKFETIYFRDLESSRVHGYALPILNVFYPDFDCCTSQAKLFPVGRSFS